MGTNPLIDYEALYKNKKTSYVDPSTGKTTYIDYLDPTKETKLTPMNLSNPTPIVDTPSSTGLDDMVQQLLKSMAPSARGASGPMSYDLPGIFAGFAKGSNGVGDKNFNDLIGRIGAPSSVDQVQQGLETQSLKQLMGEIDRMTRGTVATTKLDALDKGMGGTGGVGDIEANAVAQARAGGDRTKTAGMLQAYQAELERQKAREKDVNAAFGKRYELGAAEDTQGRALMADLLGKEYAGGITQREGVLDRASKEGMNYMNTLLSYAVKKGELSQDDAQFYARLVSQENTAAADRQAAYDRAVLGGRKQDKDWTDYFKLGLDTVKTVTGGAQDLWGGENPAFA